MSLKLEQLRAELIRLGDHVWVSAWSKDPISEAFVIQAMIMRLKALKAAQ